MPRPSDSDAEQEANGAPARMKGPSGELALIERIRRRAGEMTRREVRLGIGDDCAILRPGAGEEMVVTTDLSIEGVHFRRDWHPAASVGHRTLARGLSDLAAMGARPVAAFLSLALPRAVAYPGGNSGAASGTREARWLEGFFDGLMALAKLHGVPLAGGDTAQAPGDAVIADIVLLGGAPAGQALRRSGARVGDVLYCTGALGGAAAELAQLSAAPRKFCAASANEDHPHLFPQPRLTTGRALRRRRLATACIDMSDGLSTDLAHLCAASGVAAEVDARALPLHPLTQLLDPDAQMQAGLHGGEDYELLFTAPASTLLPRKLGGVAVTPIGRIRRRSKGQAIVTLVEADGRKVPLEARGWEHFRSA